MISLSHAFHTWVPCRSGSRVRDDKNLDMCLVFHAIQKMGLAPFGGDVVGRCAGSVIACNSKNVYGGACVRLVYP